MTPRNCIWNHWRSTKGIFPVGLRYNAETPVKKFLTGFGHFHGSTQLGTFKWPVFWGTILLWSPGSSPGHSPDFSRAYLPWEISCPPDWLAKVLNSSSKHFLSQTEPSKWHPTLDLDSEISLFIQLQTMRPVLNCFVDSCFYFSLICTF